MKGRLKQRQQDILKMLITSTVPLNIDTLKEKLGKSERTIRYDINELKEVCGSCGVSIKYKTKTGFYIPTEQKTRCSRLFDEETGSDEPEVAGNTDEMRIRELYFYFLVRKRDTIAEQIAGDFYFSRSTLIRMIGKFNEKFDGMIHLTSYRTGGYELGGDEFAIRHVGMEYLAECFKGSYTPEDWYLFMPETAKSSIDLNTLMIISNQIKKINARYNVWLSNSSFINLLSYCIIRTLRLRRFRELAGSSGESGEVSYSGYAADLLKVPDYVKASESVRELEYMRKILSENEILVSDRRIDEESLRGSIQKIMDNLAERHEKFESVYDGKRLEKDLFDHLKNALCFLISREENDEENYIVVHEVKDNYPEFYEEARSCAAILEEDFHVRFNETEICYIGIYLYKNCRIKERKKKKVLLVCATGKGLSHLLSIRVENTFPGIQVMGQRSPFQLSNLMDEKEIDFIISTIPIKTINIPVVKISRILSTEDIKRIQEFLDYGNLVDEIPLGEQANASFSSKADPFQIEQDGRPDISLNSMVASATTISKLILTLLEYTSKFPEDCRMEQDALLGLIIHMSMAIPRWFQNDTSDTEEDIEQYAAIARKQGSIFEIMEKFFTLVESSLLITIPVKERIAFFLYII